MTATQTKPATLTTLAVAYVPKAEPVYHATRRPNAMSRIGIHPPTRDLSILTLVANPNPEYDPGIPGSPKLTYIPREVWIRCGLNFFWLQEWEAIKETLVVKSRLNVSILVFPADNVTGSPMGDIRDFSPNLVKILTEYVLNPAVLSAWREQRLPSDVDEVIKARIVELQEQR